MLTHKEFYVWLDGFMTNRDWTTIKQVDIEIIQNKMKQVKDNEFKSNMLPFQNIPIPVNPFPIEDDLGYPPKIVM